MPVSLRAIPHDVGRNPRGARPVIVEIVSQEDAQSDMTAAGDIHAGLGPDFDVHLIHLGDHANRLSRRVGALSLAVDNPRFDEMLVDILRSLQAEIVHTHRFADLARIGHGARDAGASHLIHTINDTTEIANGRDLSGLSSVLNIHKPLLVAVAGVLPDDFDLGNRPVACVPQGVDCHRYEPGNAERARRRIGLPQNAKIVGCASPIAHLDPFLRAIKEVDGDVHVALFGEAKPNAGRKRWLQQVDMEEKVHVLGPWADPAHVYQAMDAYFHGPAAIPYPRPVLAAQATGISVVATAPTCVNTIGPTGGTLMEMPSVPVLAAAIDEAIRKLPQPAARQFIESNWNADATVDAYRDVFDSLTAKAGRASSGS